MFFFTRREETLDTRQAIEALRAELGPEVTHGLVYRLLFSGVIPRPAKKVGPAYFWSPQEVEAARQVIARRRAGKAVTV
jgi:hypothetical protein